MTEDRNPTLLERLKNLADDEQNDEYKHEVLGRSVAMLLEQQTENKRLKAQIHTQEIDREILRGVQERHSQTERLINSLCYSVKRRMQPAEVMTNWQNKWKEIKAKPIEYGGRSYNDAIRELDGFFNELDAEVERITRICAALVGEETLHQEGIYETEMQKLQAEIERLRVALHDAIRRPMGVVPDSAEDFYSQEEADAAEARRVEKR